MQPGNPKLCGKVPLTLRGIVATFVSSTSQNLTEAETLGACNGAAERPGTTPELGPSHAPSGGSGSSEPAAKLGQGDGGGTSIGAIVGGTLGGLVGVVLIGAAIAVVVVRRNRRPHGFAEDKDDMIEPPL